MSAQPVSPTPAFERFVDVHKLGEDLSGLVAYAIYKTSKREWAIQQSERRGGHLTREEADRYLDFLTPDLERRIKLDAEEALKIFAAKAIDREARRNGSFLKDVGAGVSAAAIWSLLLIAIGILVAVLDVDVFSAVEKIHHALHPGP